MLHLRNKRLEKVRSLLQAGAGYMAASFSVLCYKDLQLLSFIALLVQLARVVACRIGPLMLLWFIDVPSPGV